MSKEIKQLLVNANDDSQPNVMQFGEKHMGAGYYRNTAGIHTAVFSFDAFVGAVKIQATLELHPGDNDWFDVIYDSSDVILTALDSTPLNANAVCVFTGKFVFLRAAYQLSQGTISEIVYNY